MEEPFLPQPVPPAGEVQQGRDVVGGDAVAGRDGDGGAAVEGPGCDDVASVADTAVVHQAGHGVDTPASVVPLVRAHCYGVDVVIPDNPDDFLLCPEPQPGEELTDEISVWLDIFLRLRPPLLPVVHQHPQGAPHLLAGLPEDEAPHHLHCRVVELQVPPVLRAQPVVVPAEDCALQAVGGMAPSLAMAGTERVAAPLTLLPLPHLVQALQAEGGGGVVRGPPAQSSLGQDELPGLDVPAGHQVTAVLGARLDTPGQAVSSCNVERENVAFQ